VGSVPGVRMDSPTITASPPEGGRTPVRMLIVVDFPAAPVSDSAMNNFPQLVVASYLIIDQ
jgi:hypothetical protein